MPAILKYRLRYKIRCRHQHALDRVLAHTAASAITRILIVSDGLSIPDQQQFTPLFENRRRIFDAFGVVFDQRPIDDVLDFGPISDKYNAVFAKLPFEISENEAIEKIVRLRCRLSQGVKLVYFEGEDDLRLRRSALLELVDLYVKKHVFTDLNWYQEQFVDKDNLADYVATISGRPLARSAIRSSVPIPNNQINKIVAGYNMGLDERITSLFRNTRPATPLDKKVDVMCRAACAPDNSSYPLGKSIAAVLEPLSRRGFNVLMRGDHVDQAAYYNEMRSSRICVSPFGHGELCWRDFEAILMGSLLVKPDMSHVRTEPNIFIPGQTYVPVRWDYSNLAEVCARYLADDEERDRITRNAYRVLSDYYLNSGFLKCFSRLLARAAIQPSADKW